MGLALADVNNILRDYILFLNNDDGVCVKMKMICLVSTQLTNCSTHFLFIVDSESFLFCDARQLHILSVQFFLHYLFQCLEHKRLCLGESKGSVILVLQLSLGTFTTGADSLCIVSVKCS